MNYENSELNAFKNIKCLGEISNNWPSNVLETNVYKSLELCWQLLLTILQWNNITLVISKLGKFSPFSFLVILLLVIRSNSIVWGVKSSR